MIEITRGAGQATGQYTIQLGEEMLMFLERGTLSNTAELVASVTAHSRCDLYSDAGCLLSRQRLVEVYGSLEDAERNGITPVDCSEDLAYLYDALSKQMQLLFQSRFLRTVRDAPRALPSRVAQAQVSEPALLDLLDYVEPALFDADTGTWKPTDNSSTSVPKIEDSIEGEPKNGVAKHKLTKGGNK